MIAWEIKRHVNYFRLRGKIHLMQMLEYRTELVSLVLASYGYNIMMLFFLHVLFQNISELAGWSYYEILALYAVAELVFYSYYVFFGSIYKWSDLVTVGKFDFYLLKPLNPFFNVSIDELRLIEMIPSLAIPMVILWLSWTHLDLSFGMNTAAAVISLCLSIVIDYLLYQVIGILSFWLSDTKELLSLFDMLGEVDKFPMEIFPWPVRVLLFTVIPMGIIAYVPTYFLVKGFRIDLFIYQLLFTLAFGTFTLWLWKKALKNYSSANI